MAHPMDAERFQLVGDGNALMSTLMNGARILLDCLAQEGVGVIFGYPGGVTLHLY